MSPVCVCVCAEREEQMIKQRPLWHCSRLSLTLFILNCFVFFLQTFIKSCHVNWSMLASVGTCLVQNKPFFVRKWTKQHASVKKVSTNSFCSTQSAYVLTAFKIKALRLLNEQRRFIPRNMLWMKKDWKIQQAFRGTDSMSWTKSFCLLVLFPYQKRLSGGSVSFPEIIQHPDCVRGIWWPCQDASPVNEDTDSGSVDGGRE